MEKASAALDGLIRELGLGTKVELYRIRAEWGKTFQGPISLHSYPSGLNEGILQVNVDSPVWLQQMNYFKRDLVKKLGSHDVKDIRFKLGRVGQETRTHASPDSAASLNDEDRSFIDDVVSQFHDELGSSIRDAMENWALKRRKK